MADSRTQVLAGTLDLLILKTLSVAVMHGYGIVQHIRRLSNGDLRIEEGSVYPALQRMLTKGWIVSETKKTPTGREARYFKVTPAGRRQLATEEEEFKRSVAATTRVLRSAEP
jgi:transcriptional regulator